MVLDQNTVKITFVLALFMLGAINLCISLGLLHVYQNYKNRIKGNGDIIYVFIAGTFVFWFCSALILKTIENNIIAKYSIAFQKVLWVISYADNVFAIAFPIAALISMIVLWRAVLGKDRPSNSILYYATVLFALIASISSVFVTYILFHYIW